MAGPNYNSAPIKSAATARKYLRLICRLADVAFRLIQASPYSDAVKQKATDWRELCQELCAAAELAYDALPPS